VWNGLRDPKTGRLPLILHTLYPTFFNAEFANCNDVRILKVGKPLTMEIRKTFNDLVRAANKAITDYMHVFMERTPLAEGRNIPIDVDLGMRAIAYVNPQPRIYQGFLTRMYGSLEWAAAMLSTMRMP
jgi:hypothetical protein